MKKMLALLFVLVAFCCVGHGFAATYDASGTWTSTNSNFSIDQGNSGDCTDDTGRTESVTINQNGDSFTVTTQGQALSGTISGAYYSATTRYSEDGGTTTVTISITLTSSTSASGTSEWYWTDGTYYCEGSHDISLTKASSSVPDTTTYDATGSWNANVSDPSIDQGNSGDCTGEAAHTETITISQTGETFTATNAKGRTFSGTVSGSTYSGSASYTNNGGSVTETIEINTMSETSASGTGGWNWSDGTYYCSGTYSMTLSKGDPPPPSGGDGGGGGGCFISALVH